MKDKLLKVFTDLTGAPFSAPNAANLVFRLALVVVVALPILGVVKLGAGGEKLLGWIESILPDWKL